MQVMSPEHHPETYGNGWATERGLLKHLICCSKERPSRAQSCAVVTTVSAMVRQEDKLMWSFHVVKVSVLSVSLYLDYLLHLF